MMKKKITLILLAICMMFSMLACGASTGTGTESGAEEKNEAETVVKENPKTVSEHFSRKEAKVWFVTSSFKERAWPKSVIVVKDGEIKVYEETVLRRMYQLTDEKPIMGKFTQMSDKEIVAELEQLYDSYIEQSLEEEKQAMTAIRSKVAEWTAADNGAKVSAWIEKGGVWQYYSNDQKHVIPVQLINEYENIINNYPSDAYPVANLEVGLCTDEAGNVTYENFVINHQIQAVDFWADQFVYGNYKPYSFGGKFETTGKEKMSGRMYYDVNTVAALDTTKAQMIYHIVGAMEQVTEGNTTYAGYTIQEPDSERTLMLATSYDKDAEFLLDNVE